ncbi:MAG: DUF11 domain-containing protein [Candidatus Sericytochromatia bacterium]|nr:DUF11 domain-containing protein [Candidatus Sericytochromatia bacterium]
MGRWLTWLHTLLVVSLLLVCQPAQAAFMMQASATPTVATAGVSTTINYTVTGTNTSTYTTTMTLTDRMPSFMTYNAGTTVLRINGAVVSTTNPTTAGTPVTCSWDNAGAGWVLNPGISWSLTFSGTLNTAVQGNFASTFTINDIEPTQPTNDPVQLFETAIVSVGAPPSMFIGKTVSPGTVATSGIATYTITCNNTGGASTNGLVITDTLPAGFTYNPGSSVWNGGGISNPAISGQVLTWSIPTTTGLTEVPGNTARVLTFTITAPAANGTFDNNASVAATNVLTDSTGDTATLQVGTGAVMTVCKGIGVAGSSPGCGTSLVANAGDQFRYMITITNPGTTPITINRVEDYRPVGSLYQVGSSTGSLNGGAFTAIANPTVVSNTMTWSAGPVFPLTLAAGQTYRIRWNHIAVTGKSGTYNNRVCVFTTNTVGNCTPPTAPLIINGPVYGISKTVITPATAQITAAGGVVTYEMTITNSGLLAGQANISDTFTTGWTYVNNSSSLSTNGGAFANPGNPGGANPTRTWGPFNVPVGQNIRLRFNVNVPAGFASGAYPNNAQVGDGTFPNNDLVITGDTAPVTVNGAPQISTEKTVTPASVLSYQTVVYKIKIRNASTAPVSGVVSGITDSLPTGFQYQPGTSLISTNDIAYVAFQDPTGTTGTIAWSGGAGFNITLAAGAERYLKFTVQAGGSPGTFMNTATAQGLNFLDVSTGLTAPVTVSNGPVVTVCKGAATPIDTTSACGAAATVAAGGGQIAYTMTLTNTGPVSADSVVISDTLPTGFSFIAGSTAISVNGGAFLATGDCSPGSGTVTWSGPFSVPANGNIRLRFNAQTTTTSGSYNNTAGATGSNISPVTSGATATVTVGTPPLISISPFGGTPASTVSPASGGPGSTNTYNYRINNTGGAATATAFTANLPQYVSIIPGTAFYSLNGAALVALPNPTQLTGMATWTGLPTIPTGQYLIIQFNTAIDAVATNGTYLVEGSAVGSNYANTSVMTSAQNTNLIPPYVVSGASAVDLISFTAASGADGVRLRWQSGTEWRNLGYSVHRTTDADPGLVRLNQSLIGGLGTSTTGGHYEFLDATAQPGHAYTYWLEDAEFGGRMTRRGPLTIAVPNDGTTTTAAWQAPTHTSETVPVGSAPNEPASPSTTTTINAMREYLTVEQADDHGVTLLLKTPPVTLLRRPGETIVALPGLPVTHDQGHPQVPEAVVPLSVPRDLPYRLEVLAMEDPVVIEDLSLPVLATPIDSGSTIVGNVFTSGAASSNGNGGVGRPLPGVPPTVTVAAAPAPAVSDTRDCNCPGKAPAGVTPSVAPVLHPPAGLPATIAGRHMQFAFGTLAAGSPYPAEAATIGNPVDVRHDRILQLKLYPVQYDPAKLRLTQYKTLRVRLTIDGDATLASDKVMTPWDKAMQLLAGDYGLLRRWVTTSTPIVDGFVRPSGATWRLTVRAAGPQWLSAGTLTAAGVTLDQPERLRLRHGETEVPLDRMMQAGQLAAIAFVAPTAESLYADTMHYELSLADAAPAAMATRSVAPAGDATPGQLAQTTQHLEENHIYWANKPVDDQPDHWYWDYVSTDHDKRDLAFRLAAPSLPSDDGLTASVRIGLRGLVRDPAIKTNNHVTVALNGTQIGDLRWSGQSYLDTTVGCANTLLRPGANTLTVALANDTGTAIPVAYVDRFDVTYWRTTAAAAGTLTGQFAQSGGSTWRLDGFATAPLLYDLTEPKHPVRLNDAAFAGTAATLTETDAAPAHTYWAGEESAAGQPDIQGFTYSDDLHGSTSGTDYLIITPTAFRAEADRLAMHRSTQNLQTRVVTLESIYDEFSGGDPDPQAIRRFLRWAVTNWPSPAPSYVVLFGDGHFDFRNYYGTSKPVMMPPLLLNSTEVGAVSNENGFASVIGDDDLPDLMVGRLPADTLESASAIVDKLITYDQAAGDAWHMQGLLVSDNDDPGFAMFTSSLNEAYIDRLNWQSASTTEGEQIRRTLNTGLGLTVYVGHGYVEGWASEQALSIWRSPNGTNDIDAMEPNDQTGIMVTANCLNGYFHDPDYASLGESLIRAPHKGSVAFWGTAGYTIPEAQYAMTRRFAQHMLVNGADLGTASTLAKLGLFFDDSPFWRQELTAWVLLGDPATVMRKYSAVKGGG